MGIKVSGARAEESFLLSFGARMSRAGSIHRGFLMLRPRRNEFLKFVFVVREWRVIPEIYAHSKEIKGASRVGETVIDVQRLGESDV